MLRARAIVRARSLQLNAQKNSTRHTSRRIIKPRDVDLDFSERCVMVQLLLAEERREDPLIVTLNAVVSEY